VKRTVRAAEIVPADPETARALWTDVRRWPTFVEGFAHVVEVSRDWPEEGARLVWQSNPAGRGRVTEKVVKSDAGRLTTQVYEDALVGEQTVTFEPAEEGTRVELRLEYELARSGPLRGLADVLFIRRALRDALRRTLGRFAVEAEEEAILPSASVGEGSNGQR
jgi:ribosome-associated toxin RatA of RatAB toxin-antitoxin module